MEPDWSKVAYEITHPDNTTVAAVEALRAAYALGKRDIQKWLPIADAPRNGMPVLLYIVGQITEARYFPFEASQNHEGADTSIGACWSCADGVWQIEVEVEGYGDECGHLCYDDGPATHYMPLPSPPENTP